MRKFLQTNAEVFTRLNLIEKRQVQFETGTEEHFKKIFDALQKNKPKQGIFYNGQVFEAYSFVCDLVKSVKSSIVLINTYVDEKTLLLISKRRKNVSAIIYTKNIPNELKLDLKKHNAQDLPVEIKKFQKSHDRFLILDSKTIYQFGASLKDLGTKWFAFSQFETQALDVLSKLSQKANQPI